MTPPRPAEHTDMAVPSHDAALLTNGGATAHILLDGQLYTLRITRARKLILTK
ncbi:hemin uptake protein HemP [Roseinatronobacter sp.]